MNARRRIEDLFGADVRTLALFRVGLGAILLYVHLSLLPHLSTFFSDMGVLPRTDLLRAPDANWWSFSLHLAFGGWVGPLLLSLAGIAAAGALLIGWRTRTATVVSWILMISIIVRNPFILHGGDQLLRLLLFWSMFLPLGDAFSVDAALSPDGPPPPRRRLSLATLGILLQLCMMYWTSVATKSHPAWTVQHSAVWEALQYETLVSPLGLMLQDAPYGFLQVLTVAVRQVELWAPLAFLLPVFTGPVRTAAAFTLISMHAGFALFLDLGHFPYTAMVALSITLPSWFWDRIARPLHPKAPDRLCLAHPADRPGSRNAALLARTFLALPDLPLRPGDRWTLVDADARERHGADALVALCELSPIARLPGLLLKAAPRAAARVARGAERLAARLRPRSSGPTRPPLAATVLKNAVLAAGIAYVVVLNLWMTGVLTSTVHFRTIALGDPLHLGQSWPLFAPRPSLDDGWFVAKTSLLDGRTVDLIRGGTPLSWEKPPSVSEAHGSARWKKYLENLRRYQDPINLRNYVRWLRADWARSHPDIPDQIPGMSIELYYVVEETLEYPRVAAPRRVLLWPKEPPEE